MPWVAGIVDDEDKVQEAIESLQNHHFEASQISVLVCDERACEEIPVVRRLDLARGAAAGGALGAVVGAGAISAGLLGPIAIVGIGPVLAILEGAAAGAATGTLAGALGALGFWKDEADLQAREIAEGAIWVGVITDIRLDDAEAALREVGARHVTRVEDQPRAAPLGD